MEEYQSFDHMQGAFAQRLEEAAGRVQGVRVDTRGLASEGLLFSCSLIVLEAEYTLEWVMAQDSPLVSLYLYTTASNDGGLVTIQAPFEAPEGPLREVLTEVASFQATFDISGQSRRFYGFGVGLDPEEHRKICELVGVEGCLWRRGTSLRLGGELLVVVPHSFFRDLGARMSVVSSEYADSYLEPAFNSADAFRSYLSKLLRHRATLELLERTFDV